ncbi:MAG: hypothetical protein ACRC28_18935 [Clostridium sp.]|uniref:hypothetical protein n=1 Tax=Clostridium sp. TaxID=1506 RepID=UPI003F2E7740
MGISKMQGTSSQLEYIGPTGRVHRKFCKYNKDGKCNLLKAPTYLCKCVGRLQCGRFVEMTDKEKEIAKKEAQKKAREAKKQKESKKSLVGKKAEIRLMTGEIIIISLVEDGKESVFHRKYSVKSQIGISLKTKKKGSSITLDIGGSRIQGTFIGFKE